MRFLSFSTSGMQSLRWLRVTINVATTCPPLNAELNLIKIYIHCHCLFYSTCSNSHKSGCEEWATVRKFDTSQRSHGNPRI